MKLGEMDTAEIAMESQKRDDVRVFHTPFGKNGGTWVLGETVDWAGVEGMEALRAVKPDVAAGLEKAQEVKDAVKNMSEGEKSGVVVVKYPNGDRVTMPKFAYQMMKKQGKNVELLSAQAPSRPQYVEGESRAVEPSGKTKRKVGTV